MSRNHRPTWLIRVRNAVALSLVPVTLLLATPAIALETGGTGTSTNAAQGLDLDLSSKVQSIRAGSDVFKSSGGSATINVGGTAKTIAQGSQITPAELVAVQQVLTRGTQRLVLDAAGAAIGGSFRLSSVTQSQLASLVIPAGVVAIGRAAMAST